MAEPTATTVAKPPGYSKASGLRRHYQPSFAPIAPLDAGTLIAGKYKIVASIGQGGMGAVYRAEHVAMRRTVAVKVMRSEYAGDPSMADRFEREAQASSRIHSPHVITIYDFGRADDGLLYLVMELLQGRPLATRLEDEMVLPWREAVRVSIGIARALDAAHRAGVVHRDIKPDNVFLCEGGTLKILDFGIARLMATDAEPALPTAKHLTQAGTLLGTPLYMSPEAVAHESVGPPADLYALGAILFEMITGRLLFEEEQVVLLLGAHLKSRPDRMSEARPDLSIPPELDALVESLVAKKPKDRPASAADVVKRLEAILTRPVEASSPAWRPHAIPATPPPPSRPPPKLSGAPALELGTAGIGVVSLLSTGALEQLDADAPAAPRTERADAPLPAAEGARAGGAPGGRDAAGPPAVAPAITPAPAADPARSDTTGALLALGADPTAHRSILFRATIGIVVAGVAAGALVAVLVASGESGGTPEAAAVRPIVAAPALVRMTVRLAPAPTTEALVTWDGSAVAGAGFEVESDGLPHALRVTAPGYLPHESEVVADGPATIEVALASAAVENVLFEFATTPSGARVSENGVPLVDGRATLVRGTEPHTFLVEADGYESQSITLVADQSRRETVTLRRAGAGAGTAGPGTRPRPSRPARPGGGPARPEIVSEF